MAEQRLIDANEVYEIIGQTGVARVHVTDIDQIKRIDPETLPIVRELREKLERVTAEMDAAMKDIEQAITIYRDVEGWDILCRFCNGKSCLNDGECNPKWRSLRKEE